MGSYILSSSTSHPINMKFLVLTVFVTVSSAASYAGLQSHPNGAVTPVDEPAVAAARADHLATKFGAGLGYAGYAPGYAGYAPGYAGYAPGYAAGYAPGYAGYGYAGYAAGYGAGYGYSGYGAGYGYAAPVVATGYAGYAASAPVIAAAPVVAAVPAVAAAPVAAVGYGYAGPLNLNTQLVAHPNGAVVPLDEPAVAAARADHLAAHGY